MDNFRQASETLNNGSIVSVKFLGSSCRWMDKKMRDSAEAGSYIGKLHCAVPLHRVLHLGKAAVVPTRQLETQWPVGRDDRPANELHSTETTNYGVLKP